MRHGTSQLARHIRSSQTARPNACHVPWSSRAPPHGLLVAADGFPRQVGSLEGADVARHSHDHDTMRSIAKNSAKRAHAAVGERPSQALYASTEAIPFAYTTLGLIKCNSPRPEATIRIMR